MSYTSSKNRQILFSKSKFFIPADSIPLTFPLYITFNSYITTENAIADLLYANLKLKQLLEEYKDIQARSKRINKELKVSIWDSQNLFLQAEGVYSIHETRRRLIGTSIQTTVENDTMTNFHSRNFGTNRIYSSRDSFRQNRNF